MRLYVGLKPMSIFAIRQVPYQLDIRERTVRFNRRARAVIAALVVAISVGACSTGSTDSATDTVGESSSTGAPASPEAEQPIQAPDAPTGKWAAPGDLCKIITPDLAADVLGYDGVLTPSSEADDLPAAAGLDACRYTDPSHDKGITVLLSVRKGVTDAVWGQTEKEYKDGSGIYETTDYDVEGVDGVLANSSQQVVVRMGELMASGLNSSLGKFDQEGLVRLTALAASIF
jgi:hypothetical protein